MHRFLREPGRWSKDVSSARLGRAETVNRQLTISSKYDPNNWLTSKNETSPLPSWMGQSSDRHKVCDTPEQGYRRPY